MILFNCLQKSISLSIPGISKGFAPVPAIMGQVFFVAQPLLYNPMKYFDKSIFIRRGLL
jgi:hypothetical protein